jgi:hypothetical protein
MVGQSTTSSCSHNCSTVPTVLLASVDPVSQQDQGAASRGLALIRGSLAGEPGSTTRGQPSRLAAAAWPSRSSESRIGGRDEHDDLDGVVNRGQVEPHHGLGPDLAPPRPRIRPVQGGLAGHQMPAAVVVYGASDWPVAPESRTGAPGERAPSRPPAVAHRGDLLGPSGSPVCAGPAAGCPSDVSAAPPGVLDCRSR